MLLLAAALTAGAQTNQYGRIYENDGAPNDLANGQLKWTYEVIGGNYGNTITFRLGNIFSTSEPVKLSSPAF